MSAVNIDIDPKKIKEKSRPGQVIAEILVMLLFIIFMLPFAIVVINAAKIANEIVFSPVALPES